MRRLSKGGREWRGWIGMRLDQLPVSSGGDPASCWMDVSEWPVTITSGLHRKHENPTLRPSQRR